MISEMTGVGWDVSRDFEIEKRLINDIKTEHRYDRQEDILSIKRVGRLILCLRRVYFSFKIGKQEQIPAETVLTFSIGDALHDYYLNKFKSLGLVRETTFKRDLVSGHTDLLTYDNCPVEFKPTRKYIKEDGSNIPLHYFMQLMSYCWLSQKDTGYLIILRINNPILLVFKFKFKETALQYIGYYLQHRLNLIFDAVNRKKPANELPKGSSWECKKCQYTIFCRAIDELSLKHSVT